MKRLVRVLILASVSVSTASGQPDPGDCQLIKGSQCSARQRECTTSDGKAGQCTPTRGGCECAPYNICHYDNTTQTYKPLRLPEKAVPAHLGHGDCEIDDEVDCSVDRCDPVLGCVSSFDQCITIEGVLEHLAALQAIADANNGHRTSGTSGYDESADYVANRMLAAGYNVIVQEFQFQTFISLTPTILEQVTPPPAGSIANSIMSYSGSGDVTAPVTALPEPPIDATPGCEAADFAGFPAGNIALISRAACTFAIKATNAYNAGASGVIIYNNFPGIINGTLGNDFALDIPVTSVTESVGEQLAATPGLVLRLKTDTFRGMATTSNVFAESPGGDPSHVVMAGAHLDSVNAGPGIQDNGSGSAALLEIARAMAPVTPTNKVRFAWWGAEEAGLVGSSFYVTNLAQEERDKIALYLNFDMIGSPNHVFFIYDGDDSDGVGFGPGPAGSELIEKFFEDHFDARGIPYKGTDFSGRSDYGPFIDVGIPAGGLFTGAEGIKTVEEAALWGGTAGEQYDPCYHLACDTYDNVNHFALEVNTHAAAAAIMHAAMNGLTTNVAASRSAAKQKAGVPEYLGSKQQR